MLLLVDYQARVWVAEVRVRWLVHHSLPLAVLVLPMLPMLPMLRGAPWPRRPSWTRSGRRDSADTNHAHGEVRPLIDRLDHALEDHR